MDFDSYIKLISESVASCGYDRFMPSLCLSSETVELHVLELDPQPAGDKHSALEWAAGFTNRGGLLFCAYRAGGRHVEVVEINGAEVTKKISIDVRLSGD